MRRRHSGSGTGRDGFEFAANLSRSFRLGVQRIKLAPAAIEKQYDARLGLSKRVGRIGRYRLRLVIRKQVSQCQT